MERWEDYRDKYFEEKFQTINERLDEILKQTKLTNGRVSKLEIVQASCPINQVKDDLDVVKTDTEAVRFFSKHPFLAKLLVTAFVLLTVANLAVYVLKYWAK